MERNTDMEGTMGRRSFVRAGAGLVVASGAIGYGAGTAAAAYDGWLDDTDNYEGTFDYTGQSEVEVTVGAGNGLLYDPPAILVDPGTTVVWEWSGEGGQHDVSETEGAFQSDLTDEAGATFEHTFEDEGTFKYVCTPHEAVDMKAVVAVGDTEDDLIDPAGSADGDETNGEADDTDGDDDEGAAGPEFSLAEGDLLAIALGLAMTIPLVAIGLGYLDLDPK